MGAQTRARTHPHPRRYRLAQKDKNNTIIYITYGDKETLMSHSATFIQIRRVVKMAIRVGNVAGWRNVYNEGVTTVT